MLTKSKSEWSNHKKLTRAETINNCKMWFCPKWDNNQILSNQYKVYDIKQPYLFSTNLINKWKFNHWGSFSNSSWWTSNKYDFALKKKNQHFPWSLRCLFFKTANVVNSYPFLSNRSLFSDGSSWLALHNLWCASHWKKIVGSEK